LEQLRQLAREVREEVLSEVPPEELVRRASEKLSVDELLAALPADKRAALIQRLKENGERPNSGGK